MITEIVYWNSQSQKLVAPLYDEKKGINPVTRRYEPIASRDINNDAIFEVPVQIILPDSGYASPNLLSSDAMGAVQTDPAAEEQKLSFIRINGWKMRKALKLQLLAIYRNGVGLFLR